jgi:hypothetical protein
MRGVVPGVRRHPDPFVLFVLLGPRRRSVGAGSLGWPDPAHQRPGRDGASMRPGAPPSGLTAGGRLGDWGGGPARYVALDVDGTLIDDVPVPPPAVLDAVGRLTDAGVRVGLATGRMAASADGLLATGAFSGPHVFHNGAVVTDGDGTERSVLGLADADVDALLDFARTRDDLALEIYAGRTYLSDRDDPRTTPHARLLGVDPDGRIGTSADLAGRPAVKAVAVCFDAEAVEATLAATSACGLGAGPAGSPATPQLRYVNITRAGVDKGSGVAAAAELLGVDLAQVAGVGDETNDLPMLARVGTAIAMGGAADAVRDMAHLVAPPFGAGGTLVVLEALRRLAADAQRAPGTW